MDLQQYDGMKSALAEVLRAATMGPLSQPARETVRDLFARLAEDRFNLVVVGRFSRGKTSLMNAMLGTDRLPTGIVPVTSVITTVTYGTEEKVVLYYQHTNLFFEIPIPQLAEHITERGNPGNGRCIQTAEVQLPADLLRRGFHFIDTPGLGSSIVENTRTTEAFLPQADAFILVTSFDSPLTEDEVARPADGSRLGATRVPGREQAGQRERGTATAGARPSRRAVAGDPRRCAGTAVPALRRAGARRTAARQSTAPRRQRRAGVRSGAARFSRQREAAHIPAQHDRARRRGPRRPDRRRAGPGAAGGAAHRDRDGAAVRGRPRCHRARIQAFADAAGLRGLRRGHRSPLQLPRPTAIPVERRSPRAG